MISNTEYDDSESESEDSDTENDDSYVDSTLLCPLKRYILAKDMNAVKRLLCERKKNPIQLRADKGGWTALHFAAFDDRHADFLKLLLSNKDIVRINLNAQTFEGKTALYLACYRGCIKNCKILLKSQCNPEMPDIYGYTPLHIASLNGHADIVSELIPHGLNVNCKNLLSRDTALHYASRGGNLEVVRVLMRSKQTKINIRNLMSQLPLHMACTGGSVEIVKILLEADHCQINEFEGHSSTPLTAAVGCGRVDCVKYLLEQGATANCGSWDNSALLIAARITDTEILKLVLQATSPMYIREQFKRKMQVTLRKSYLWSTYTFESLMSIVMNRNSPECMSLLLKSAIPKGILETPRIINEYNSLVMYSPLAHLFDSYKRDKFEEKLQLLLKYNITHLYEFNQMVDWKADCRLIIHYVHPFTNIFSKPFSDKDRDHYLNTLFEYGITTDYCLQCDVHYDGSFLDFDVNVLNHFYQPVLWAMEEDKAELIELLLVNSAILEPSHVWNCKKLVMLERENQNVVNYLNDLGVIVNTSNVPLYLVGGTIKNPNLQQLCRQAIRKHLRDVRMKDNLKNFKAKINALPLPDSLIDYLHFKST